MMRSKYTRKREKRYDEVHGTEIYKCDTRRAVASGDGYLTFVTNVAARMPQHYFAAI